VSVSDPEQIRARLQAYTPTTDYLALFKDVDPEIIGNLMTKVVFKHKPSNADRAASIIQEHGMVDIVSLSSMLGLTCHTEMEKLLSTDSRFIVTRHPNGSVKVKLAKELSNGKDPIHPLQKAFDLAIDQAVNGKGTRHGGGLTPFYDQRWKRLAENGHGMGFLTGQAQKNLEEAIVKEGDAWERGMVEVLVWVAMAILKHRNYP
jgi:hypothetical protein